MSPLFRRKFQCAVPMESIGTQTESSPQMFSDLPRSASKIVPLRCSLDHKPRLSFCKNLWLLQNPINVDSCSRCVPLCSELARLLHSSAKDNTDHNLLLSIMGTEIESLLQLLCRLSCLNVPTPHNHHVSFLTESLENLRHEWLPVSDFNYTIVETTHSISSTFYTLGLLVSNLNKVLACIHQETLHLKGFNKAIEASLVMTLYLRSYLALGCVPPLAFLKKVKTDVKSVLITSSFKAISNLEKTSVSEALQDCKEKVELAQTKYDDAVLCENSILDEFATKVASSVDVSSDDDSAAVEEIERSARTHITLPRMRKASAHAIPEFSLTTCEAKRSLTGSLLNCSVENIDHQTFLQNLAGNDMSLLSTQHLKRFCDAVNDKFQSMLSAYTVDSDIPLTPQKKKQILVILYRYYSEFLHKTLSIRTTTSQESSTSSSSIQSTSTRLSQPIKNNSSAVASDLDSYRRCTPAVCHSPAINGRLNLSVIQSSSGFTNINEALSVLVTCTSNVSNNTTATTVSVSAITTSQSPLSVPNTSTVQSALPSVTYGSNQTQSSNETMQSSPLSCLEPLVANNSHPPCQIPVAISRSPVVPLNDNRSFLANSSPNVLLNQSTPLCNTTLSLPHQNYLTDSSCNVQRVRELPSSDLFSAIPSTNHTSLPNQAQYTTATYPSTMSHVASPSLTTSNLTASTSTSLFHKSLMSSAPKPASYLNAARNSFPPQFPVQYSGFQRHDIRTPILPQNSNYTCRNNYVPKPHPSYPLQPPSVRYSGHVNVSQQSSYTYPIPISHGFSNSCMQSSPWYHRNQGGPSQIPNHYPGSNIQPVAAGFSAPRYLMTSVSTNPLSVQTFSSPCVYSSGPRSVTAATRSDVLTNLRRKIYTGHLLTSTTRNSNHTANSVQPLHSRSGPVLIPTATQQLATNSVFPITSGTQSLHSNPVLTPVPVTTATQQSLASSSSSIAQRKIYTGHLLTNSTKNTNHTVNSVQSLQSRNNPVTLTTVPVANATNSVFPITSSTQSVHSRSGPILTPVPVANATNSVFSITSNTLSLQSRSGPILTPVPVVNATNSVFPITSSTQSVHSRSGPILTPVPVANATNSVFPITSSTQSVHSRSGPILTPVPVANATNSVFPITSSTQSVHSRSGPILTPVPVVNATNSVFSITSSTQSVHSRSGPILTPVPVATNIQQSNSVFPTTSSIQPLHNPMLTPVPVYKPFTSHVIASSTTASSEPSVDVTNSTRRITNTMLASTRSFENLVNLLSLVQQGQKNPGLLKNKIPVSQTQGSKTDKVVERHASHVATAMKDAPAVYTSASEDSPLNRLINNLHSTTDPAIVNNNTVTTPSSIAICTSSSVEKVISTRVKTSVTTSTASDNPLSTSCNEPSQVHNVLTSKNSNIDLSNEGTCGNFSNTLATTIQPVITASTGLSVPVCPIVSSSSSITDNSVSSENNGSRTAYVEGSTSKFQVTSVMENVPVCTSASEDNCLINSLQTSHSTTNPAIVSNSTSKTTLSPSSIGTCISNSVEKVISTQSIDDEPSVAAKIVSSSSNEPLQVHNVLTSKNSNIDLSNEGTCENFSNTLATTIQPVITASTGLGVPVCPIVSSSSSITDNSVSSESNGSNVEGSTSKFQVTSVLENVPVCTSASEDSCLTNSLQTCTSNSVEKVISTHVKTSVTTSTASDNPLSPSCNEQSQVHVHNVLTSKNSNIDLSNEGTCGNFSNTLATTIQPVITASTGLGVPVCPIVSSSSSIADNSVSSENNGSRTAYVEGSTSKFQVTSVLENVPVCTSASEDNCLINSLQTSHSTTDPAIVSNITSTTTLSPSSIGTCTSNSVEKVISTQSIDDEPKVAATIVSSSSNEQLQVHNVLTSKNASMRIPVKDTSSSQGQFNASEKHSDASLPSTTTDVEPGVSVCSVPIISCTGVVDNSVSTSCVTTLADIPSDLSISKSCPKTSSMSSIDSVSTSCSTCIYTVSSTSQSHTSPINTFATACHNTTHVATDTNDNSTSLTTINDASKSSVSGISAPSSSTVVTITDIVSVVNSVSDPVSSASSNDNSATDNFQPSIFNAQWHKLKSAKSNTRDIPAQSPDPCVVNTDARINSSPTHKAVVSSKTDVLVLPSKLLLEAKLQKQSLVLKWNLVSKEQHLQYGIELYDICYAKLADRSCFSFDGCCSAKWMSMGVVKALMLPISVTLTNLSPNQCYAFIVKGVFIGGKTNIYSDIKLLQYIIDK